MPPNPREFFASNPEATAGLGVFEPDVRESLPSTDFLADIEPDTALESLESLSPNDRFHTKGVLQHLPPEFIVAEYGLDVLFWTVVNAYPAGREFGLGNNAMNGLVQLADIDKRGFETALSWNRQQSAILHDHQDVRTADVVFSYKVTDSLARGVENMDTSAHLQAHLKPKQSIDPDRYAIAVIRPEDREIPSAYAQNWGDKVHQDEKHGLLKYKMTMAAPGGLALMYDGRPTAFTSFGSLKEGEVIIYQMQGVKARLLDPANPNFEIDKIGFGGEGHFDWTALFVDMVEEVAVANGAHTLTIRSAHNNPWQKNGHLGLERGLEIYDKTAERLGFRQGDDQNWSKALV